MAQSDRIASAAYSLDNAWERLQRDWKIPSKEVDTDCLPHYFWTAMEGLAAALRAETR